MFHEHNPHFHQDRADALGQLVKWKTAEEGRPNPTVFDALYFDLEGKGISDGLFDSSDVLLCINCGEITCIACLCGSKYLRRVCAGFTFFMNFHYYH